ncbi:hypothetical protein V6N13_116032 [Hibiscus sabdariffa]|uniref:Uncharacterized protein n=1 Tax=Hibiscus sabdariffa TaxID=183260 RepID=A0ABR2QSK1_9ROSI
MCIIPWGCVNHCYLSLATTPPVIPSVLMASSPSGPSVSQPLRGLTPWIVFYPWKNNWDAERWFHPITTFKRLSALYSYSSASFVPSTDNRRTIEWVEALFKSWLAFSIIYKEIQ